MRSVSEEAILSRVTRRHFILNFTIKYSKSSVMVIGRGLFLSLFGQIPIRQGSDLFSKFHVRPEGFSFDPPIKSDEGADTDLIYNFCWLYLDSRFTLRIPSNIVFSSEGTL